MNPVAFMVLAVGLLIAGTAAAAAEDLPDGASMARLAAPGGRRVEQLIDGRFWSCSGETCTAGAQDTADSQPLWMECSHAAAELGAFTDYRTGSDRLEPSKLIRCNAHAKPAPPAHPEPSS